MTPKTAFNVLLNTPFVAGERSPGEGKIIKLTEEQARYPLIVGEIEPLKSAPGMPETKKVKG